MSHCRPESVSESLAGIFAVGLLAAVSFSTSSRSRTTALADAATADTRLSADRLDWKVALADLTTATPIAP